MPLVKTLITIPGDVLAHAKEASGNFRQLQRPCNPGPQGVFEKKP